MVVTYKYGHAATTGVLSANHYDCKQVIIQIEGA